MSRLLCLLLALLLTAVRGHANDITSQGQLARVVWLGASKTERESLPLPGTSGAFAMVQFSNGEVRIRLGHSGAYDADEILRGLGVIRLRPSGVDLAKPKSVRQTLLTDQGLIEIEVVSEAGVKHEWRLWFATETLIVETRSSQATGQELAFGHWRAAPTIKGDDRVTVVDGALLYAHQNSNARRTRQLAENQGIEAKVLGGVVAERAYGLAIAGLGGLRWQYPQPHLVAGAPGHEWLGTLPANQEHLITVTLGAAPKLNPENLAHRSNLLLSADVLSAVRQTARNRWEEFWRRGGVIINAKAGKGDAAHRAGLAHTLFKFIQAANQDAEIPLRPAGGTLPLIKVGAQNPDERLQPLDFTGQSLRWTAWSHVLWGDVDLANPLFRFYRERHDLAQARAKRLKIVGALYPEQLTLSGLTVGSVNAEGFPSDALVTRHFTSSLEIGWMAVQAKLYSNRDLRADLPWILNSVRSIESLYTPKPRVDPKKAPTVAAVIDTPLVLSPANALDVASGCTNPADLVAALQALVPALAQHPDVAGKDQAMLTALTKRLPELPLSKQGEVEYLALADKFTRLTRSAELPEMHAVWPFALAGVANPLRFETARATWTSPSVMQRRALGQPSVTLLASLGFADEAGQALLASWGEGQAQENFPYLIGSATRGTPDFVRAGDAMAGLHAMLVAAEPNAEGRIFLLPAWPKNWDVTFRLRVPGNTQIDAVIEGGVIRSLVINPVARRDQVVVPPEWKLPPR